MTLDDLAGRNFATTTEVAQLLDGADPRTVRRMAERGEIPCIRVGTKIMIPVAWLRQHLDGAATAEPGPAPIDLNQLADQVAGRVFARFAGLFATAQPQGLSALHADGEAPRIGHDP